MNQNIICQKFPNLCKKRKLNAHKGTFGTVGLIGGAEGMSGALLLAGASALMSGSGKVILGFFQKKRPINVWQEMPELMIQTASHLIQEKFNEMITAWVIGCGLGTQHSAFELIKKIMAYQQQKFMVFDADALNILAKINKSFDFPEHIVLTPHPGEAARLLETNIDTIENNRPASAQAIAHKYRAWVVLKGYHSIISSPDGEISVNHSGNPVLAVAGSGDVLAGLIGSLLAQSIPIEEAVHAGVWLHGCAGDNLANQGLKLGLRALELCDEIRKIRNQLIEN